MGMAALSPKAKDRVRSVVAKVEPRKPRGMWYLSPRCGPVREPGAHSSVGVGL
jgi:hypothetical protein